MILFILFGNIGVVVHFLHPIIASITIEINELTPPKDCIEPVHSTHNDEK